MQVVKDLMVPLEAFTRVPETASLYDALKALEKVMTNPAGDPARPRDRAVLVQGHDGQVLGKLSLWDVLRGLEPRYELPVEPLVVIDEYFTWTHSMFANLAEKARAIPAKNLLRGHARHETIDENAPLDQAVHQLVQGRLLSLLVMRGDHIVGVLRLSDVFTEISGMLDRAQAKAPAA
ncbi:MAG: CBS domain-containing protein [Rhodospirillales bacterium]|nr:CBS domain-containing protein [Rhodospirillales bacterium]